MMKDLDRPKNFPPIAWSVLRAGLRKTIRAEALNMIALKYKQIARDHPKRARAYAYWEAALALNSRIPLPLKTAFWWLIFRNWR